MRYCFAFVLVTVLTCGCVTVTPSGVPVPAETRTTEDIIWAPRATVFDAALAVAQDLNLNVDVLEKASGLLKFESAFLSPSQLDRFCTYPAKDPKTGEAWDTFANWNSRSVSGGSGAVTGRVALNVLMKELAPQETEVSIRATFSASNNTETNQCGSLGVLEEEFLEGLREELGL